MIDGINMKLFMIRHGQTLANVQRLFCGSSDVALTEQGQRQAQHIASRLAAQAVDMILHSDMQRTRQTASCIYHGRDVPILAQPLLREMDFGDWEMRHHDELLASNAAGFDAWSQNWQTAIVPNGESFPVFCQRVGKLLETMTGYPQHSCVVLVGHQGSLSLLLALMLGLPAVAMWSFPFQQGCVTEVEWDTQHRFCAIRRFNDGGVVPDQEKE
jgi:alpha-ribazole phosphatase